MYDTAWKQQPTNEELGVNTFSANTRAGNWKAAQQASTSSAMGLATNRRGAERETDLDLGCDKITQAIQGGAFPLLVHLFCANAGKQRDKRSAHCG